MKKSIDAEKLELQLAQDSALREKLESSLARLAAAPGTQIDEELMLRAMEEAGVRPESGEKKPAGKTVLADDELENVAGGRILFNQNGVNRNSWFVSILSMLMAQDAARPEKANELSPLQREISIDGKRYRVLRTAEGGSYQYVLEELK